MVRKLAVRSLRRGIGSMDYIHSLLIMEDDLDEGTSTQDSEMGEFGEQSGDHSNPFEEAQAHAPETHETIEGSVPDCVCLWLLQANATGSRKQMLSTKEMHNILFKVCQIVSGSRCFRVVHKEH